MILALTAIDKQAQFRDFFCQLSTLELAFDALSSIASTGDRIIKAQLVDEGKTIPLPVDIFDGQLFSPFLQQVEKEWQQVLSPPANATPVHDKWLIDLTRTQIERQDIYIIKLSHAINASQQQRQQVLDSIHLEPYRSRLISRLDKSLNLFQQHLNRVQTIQQCIFNRLSQWEDPKTV